MADFSKPSDKWDRATRADFANETHTAYLTAAAEVSPGVVCQNVTGSVHSDCPCAHCSGARASHAKSLQLAAREEWDKLTPRERARFLVHPSKRRKPDGSDVDDETIDRLLAESEGSPIVPSEEVPPAPVASRSKPEGRA